MELKAGYKQTDVGVIPQDWEVRAFGKNYSEPSRNGIYKSADYQGSGARIVNMGEMFGFDFISNQEMSRVRLTPKELATNGLRDGDLLFGRRSVVPAGAGKCSLVIEPIEPLTFESSIIRVRLEQSEANSQFHYYFFASPIGRTVMSFIIAGTNVKGIRGSELRELKIPYPSLPEQRAIATALSDVDALLAALDRLIAKKRDLKQATMQQLLTGQTRLSGFSGEWEVKRLGDVASFFKGKGLPKSAINANGLLPCIHYGELFTRYSETISETFSRTDASDATFRSISNDVLMPTSDVTPRGLAKASCVRTTGVVLGGDILIIRSDEKLINGSFLSYMIRFEENQVLQLVTGSTVYHLYGADMKKFKFLMPPLPEQNAIVVMLGDIDAELTALEQRRDKTRALKQGMMQELLNGRTRLI
jgi:type I restriction enzyme S subunit